MELATKETLGSNFRPERLEPARLLVACDHAHLGRHLRGYAFAPRRTTVWAPRPWATRRVSGLTLPAK